MKRGGNIITSPVEIADTFADYYANILRDPHKKSKPEKNKKRKKEEELQYPLETWHINSYKLLNFGIKILIQYIIYIIIYEV